MKLLHHFTVALATTLVCAIATPSAVAQPAEKQYRHEFKTAENDPLNALVYTLDNGLKVYMTVYKDEPRVQTAIAVRAGSKNDPSDATGLAHYLEHMLFKGTSEIGTTNWEAEKVLLQQISDTYEVLRNTTDEAERAKVYAKIDALSSEAAKYVAANEYDKMVSSLGATGTNAFTSLERTVYINDIPSNELSKFLALEGARFQELTLRLFHTELETVYEEFNRGQDSDFRKLFKALNELLYPNHPYGTQTTIGTGEHLKNPSMVKIHEYFEAYYRPNNVAICLSGDFDPDEVVDLVEKHFGSWKPKPVPKFSFKDTPLPNKPQSKEVFGPMPEMVALGWRLGGANSKDAPYLELAAQLLQNGQAGLMDLNLIQAQKVLNLRGGADINHDYSELTFGAGLKSGQTADEVIELVLAEIEKLKAGDFDQAMLDAVVRNIKKDRSSGLESNWARCYQMVDAFIMRKSWQTAVNESFELEKITKEELVKWANANLGNNYAVVYKRTGEDPNLHKVEKPEITTIDLNRDASSAFYEKWNAMESSRIEPVFVDYDKAIKSTTIGNNNVPLQYIHNTTNDLFTMFYVVDMGSYHNQLLPVAMEYLPYLGTKNKSAEELQVELYKLGIEMDVFAQSERAYVRLRGLEESLTEGAALLEDLLANCQPDQAKLEALVGDMLKQREDDKKSKWSILFGGLNSFARYGAENPFNNVLTSEELQAIKATELTDLLHSFTSYKHRIMYYGGRSLDDVSATLQKVHTVPAKLHPYPEPVRFAQVATTENKVYFVDYDMVQTEIMFLSRVQPFSTDLMPESSLFNEYFGSGLSSIVFQEIRESKALAYSAYAAFTTPGKDKYNHYVQGYLGTQNDKLGDAVEAMLQLLDKMPRGQQQFEAAKLAAQKKIETERITRFSIFWNAQRAADRGLDYDVRKDIYAALPNISIDDLDAFFNTYIKGRSYTFVVIGKKSEMDMEALEKLGPVQELTLQEVFGY